MTVINLEITVGKYDVPLVKVTGKFEISLNGGVIKWEIKESIF